MGNFLCHFIADKNGAEHIHCCSPKFTKGHEAFVLTISADILRYTAETIFRQMAQQDVAGFANMIGATTACRVVKHYGQVCNCGSFQAFFDFLQLVRRSLREIAAKSWVSGAPRSAAPLQAAVKPGMTSTSGAEHSPLSS